MAAWRYEISLLVLKKYFTCLLHSLVKYFSTLKEKFCISKRPCNILYLVHHPLDRDLPFEQLGPDKSPFRGLVLVKPKFCIIH